MLTPQRTFPLEEPAGGDTFGMDPGSWAPPGGDWVSCVHEINSIATAMPMHASRQHRRSIMEVRLTFAWIGSRPPATRASVAYPIAPGLGSPGRPTSGITLIRYGAFRSKGIRACRPTPEHRSRRPRYVDDG